VRGRETPISAVALEKEEARKMRTGVLHDVDDSDDDVDADDDDDVGEEEEEKVKTRFSQLLREKGLGGLATPRCIKMLSLELLTQGSIDAGVVTEILAAEWRVSGKAKKVIGTAGRVCLRSCNVPLIAFRSACLHKCHVTTTP